MISQYLFFSFLFFLGFLFIINLKKDDLSISAYLISFFIGIAIWAFEILLFGIFQIPLDLMFVIPSFLLLFLGLVVRGIHKNKFEFSKREFLKLLLIIILHGFVFYFFSVAVYNFATPDSFEYIQAGKAFSILNWNTTARNYIAFGPLLPFLETASTMINLEYLYGLIPTMMVLFLIALPILFYEGFKYFYIGKNEFVRIQIKKEINIRISIPITLSILSVFLLATNWLFQLFLFFIHSNPLAMIYMTLAFFSSWLALQKKSQAWLILSAIMGFALSISRVETFFIAILPLIFVINENLFPQNVIRRIYLPSNVIIFLWSLRKYLEGINESGLYINQMFNLGMVLISFCVVLLIIYHQKLIKWNIHLNRIAMVMLSVCLIVFVILKPAFMFSSLKNIYANLFNPSTWEYMWYLITPLFIYCLITPRKQYEEILQESILIYFLLVPIFAFIRGGTYHNRWSDSGNRMLYHLIPLMLFYTFSKVVYKEDATSVQSSDKLDL